MNTTIRDKSALGSLRPFEVMTYLRSSGWTIAREEAGKSSVWNKPAERDGLFEVVLPLDNQYRDFALRISDLLQTLAVVENRAQTEIFSDIQTASADVIRVRYRQAEAVDGTIALRQAVPLVENAREMMLAAACAAVEPRPYFATRKPDRATEYVQNLRLGPTEIGSYVLRILSPVAPRLAVQGNLFNQPEPPFERRVTLLLMRALQSLRTTAEEAMSTGQLDRFQEAIKDGVSANLCSALVRMAGQARTGVDSLTVSMSWARSRPDDAAPLQAIVFPADRFPVIEEAARLFKASAPSEEVEIRGAVVRLQRKDETGPPTGPVSLWAIIDDKPRKVHLELAEKDHQTALQAYKEGATVVCTGKLVRAGQVWTLENPRQFAIVPDEEEGE